MLALRRDSRKRIKSRAPLSIGENFHQNFSPEWGTKGSTRLCLANPFAPALLNLDVFLRSAFKPTPIKNRSLSVSFEELGRNRRRGS